MTTPAAACAICGKAHSALEPCAGAAAEAVSPSANRSPTPAALFTDSQDEMIGQSLGNFRIVRMLGKGGMGTVYLGEHAIIGSKVAIKFLHPHLVGEKTLIERFFAEATSVNLIGHENIVSIFDLSMLPPNRWYLVMEYLEGVPLSTLAGTPMPPELAVPILAQACDALQAAHAANVIHRDLKPENVFLVRRGGTNQFVKLVDFGIAKLGAQASNKPGVTAAGLVVGTPEYMSPEQWVGEDIDGRADLYALGVIAYLLATGRLPFYESSPLAYYTAHREKVPEPPRRSVPTLPEAYEAVILRALAKRREDRYQTAFEMREALRHSVEVPLERQHTPFPGRLPTPIPPAPVAPEPTPAPPLPVTAPEAPIARQVTPAPPSTPRLEASYAAPGGPRGFTCADLSKAGLFVPVPPPHPALFSRIKLTLKHPRRAVELMADVVRYVDAAQAKSWNLPGEGFAVQFAQLTPALRDVLARLVEGRDLEAEKVHPDDPKAEAALAAWNKRLHSDHYTLLLAEFDADRSDVRGKLRRAQQEVAKLEALTLSERQKAAVKAIVERLAAVASAFENPVKRAEYDASLANWKGITRCMAEGLGAPDMRSLRKGFLAAKPKNETNAQLRAVSAAAMAKGGNERAALQEFEAALNLDPLNDEFHRQYWALKRRMAREGMR